MSASMRVAPFWMFQGACEEALTFYAATLPDTRIVSLERYGEGAPSPAGTVAMARIDIAGLEVTANDSPPVHAFTFTPSTSTFLTLDDPAEVDRLATALAADGGQFLMPPDAYGFSTRFAWVQDRFGLSWQLNTP